MSRLCSRKICQTKDLSYVPCPRLQKVLEKLSTIISKRKLYSQTESSILASEISTQLQMSELDCEKSFLFRSAPHCIEYAHLIQWGQERPGEEFDADIEEHMRWVFEKATKRADEFGIPVRYNPFPWWKHPSNPSCCRHMHVFTPISIIKVPIETHSRDHFAALEHHSPSQLHFSLLCTSLQAGALSN